MGDRHPVGRGRGAGQLLGTALGLTPFALLTLSFLAIPTAIAVASAFVGEDGVTLDAIAAILSPTVLGSIGASIWISALTAVLGATVGALLCLALLGLPPTTLVRRVVDAASGTLAQFGGVMLAFAFIATIGIQGLVTVWMRDALGIDIYAGGVWLYQVPGLILPYLYFQVPLMVITFMPAVDGLRTQWAEASASLGGTRARYWLHVGGPILAPAFLGSLVLLFANAFSSFATAAALISQGGQIVTLQIRGALVSETVLGQEGLAGALALAMILIMTVLMWGYSLLQRRTERWQR